LFAFGVPGGRFERIRVRTEPGKTGRHIGIVYDANPQGEPLCGE